MKIRIEVSPTFEDMNDPFLKNYVATTAVEFSKSGDLALGDYESVFTALLHALTYHSDTMVRIGDKDDLGE